MNNAIEIYSIKDVMYPEITKGNDRYLKSTRQFVQAVMASTVMQAYDVFTKETYVNTVSNAIFISKNLKDTSGKNYTQKTSERQASQLFADHVTIGRIVQVA